MTVLGTASVRTQPDEAFVWITIATTGPAAGAALADVASRSESLVGILDEFSIAREDRSTSGITVQEEFDHTPEGRRSLAHRAAATTSIRLTDTQHIDGIIRRCVEELDVRIAGPSWRVSAENPI